MAGFFFVLLLLTFSDSLKIWIPNTNINNTLNWDKKDTPKDCDDIHFEAQTEIAVYWNLKKIIITGLSLPQTGDLIFPNNINIQFRNNENCLRSRDLKFIRHQVKGWLDPDNWKSDSEYQWLPHTERVPCAGESILFPPQRTFAVQLPSILIPIGEINFDSEEFRGDSWTDFLKTDLGFQLFKGPDDLRNVPWRNDIGCLHNKKCICGRSSYTIRDGLYRETEPFIFEEAVCLYAMPKCKPSACYSPIMPEGHCCGICGAVIKIEDNTEEGLDINDIRVKVEEELKNEDYERKLKIYVGRTKDENIQVVVIAENSDDTIKSHILAGAVKRKLTGQKLQAKISSRLSGLRFSNYLFNSVSGVVFGTFIAVVVLFLFIYYIYLILPKKKFQSSGSGNLFMFARFENIVNEENLQIGVEPEASQDLPQAFDNPMFSRNSEPVKEGNKTSLTNNLQPKKGEVLQISESTSIKEYTNPVYSELEKTKELGEFLEQPQSDEEKFIEIKF